MVIELPGVVAKDLILGIIGQIGVGAQKKSIHQRHSQRGDSSDHQSRHQAKQSSGFGCGAQMNVSNLVSHFFRLEAAVADRNGAM